MEHDHSYKLLFSHREMMADLLYIYLLVEFQATRYRYMAVRLMTCRGLLYEGLIRSR